MQWKRPAAVLALAAAIEGLALPVPRMPNAFFAMDTGTRDATHQTPAEQTALAREIGFSGVGPTYRDPAGVSQWFAALDPAGMWMTALYVPLRLDALEASLAAIKEAATALRGRDTLLWLYVTDKAHKAAAADNDEVAVPALQTVAAIARDAGLRVALYPHAGFYVERVEDAIRLIEKARRANLGVTFNLCHWLRVDGKNLEATLQAARPHLFCVTINGANNDGTSWKELIQPLGRGTYDVGQVLRLLRTMNYPGPIGLQHYGIGGDARKNLGQSMSAWLALSAAAAAIQGGTSP